jgi:hypothetical protein
LWWARGLIQSGFSTKEVLDLRLLIQINGRRTWWAWLTKAMEVAMPHSKR